MKNELTYDEVHRLFQCRTETGRLYWKISAARNIKAGEEAGTVKREGRTQYRQVQVHGKFYRVHRIIWLMRYGGWPNGEIDHIDGDGLNNRIENLRDVTHLVNQRNHRRYSHNTSGVNNVYWERTRGKWRARAYDDVGKPKFLGYFNDIRDAERAVREFQTALGYSERHGT